MISPSGGNEADGSVNVQDLDSTKTQATGAIKEEQNTQTVGEAENEIIEVHAANLKSPRDMIERYGTQSKEEQSPDGENDVKGQHITCTEMMDDQTTAETNDEIEIADQTEVMNDEMADVSAKTAQPTETSSIRKSHNDIQKTDSGSLSMPGDSIDINSHQRSLIFSGSSLKPIFVPGKGGMYQCVLCPNHKPGSYQQTQSHLRLLHQKKAISYKGRQSGKRLAQFKNIISGFSFLCRFGGHLIKVGGHSLSYY